MKIYIITISKTKLAVYGTYPYGVREARTMKIVDNCVAPIHRIREKPLSMLKGVL